MTTSIALPSRSVRMSGLALKHLIPLVCFLASFIIGLSLAATRPYPGAFDELEHVSYAAFLQETGRLLPKFEEQSTLLVEDMGRWDDRPNYLSHPSPFYLFVGLFLDRTLAPDRAILLPRLASAGLLMTGVAFALWAGRRQFGPDRAALLVFCAMLALCPKLLAVSSQVTNDSLAFLGGALAYWGASIEERQRWSGLAGVALGVAFALWAKPNAGLAVGAWLGVFVLLRTPRRRWLLPAALAAGLLVGAIPCLLIVRGYGALVPITVEQFGNVRQLDGLASYVPAFLFTIGSTWSFSQTGTWPIPGAAALAASLLFWAMVGCAALGGVLARRRAGTASAAIAIAASTWGTTAALLVGLAGCGPSGNVKTTADYHAPPAPPVVHPFFNPYAHTGEVPATWVPSVFDRNGTIVRLRDPSVEADRDDYEDAPWNLGNRSLDNGPPGTF